MNAQFDATVTAEVDRRVQVREAEHGEALTAARADATAQGARDSALATLTAMIDREPG